MVDYPLHELIFFGLAKLDIGSGTIIGLDYSTNETFVDGEAAVIPAHFSFLKQRSHWQPPGLVNKSCV